MSAEFFRKYIDILNEAEVSAPTSLTEFEIGNFNLGGDDEENNNYNTFLNLLTDNLVKYELVRSLTDGTFQNPEYGIEVHVDEIPGDSNIAVITLGRRPGWKGLPYIPLVKQRPAEPVARFSVDLMSNKRVSDAIRKTVDFVKDEMQNYSSRFLANQSRQDLLARYLAFNKHGVMEDKINP